MYGSCGTRACSTSDRRGIALPYALAALAVAGVLAFACWYITLGTRTALARVSVDLVLRDAAASAISEARATLLESILGTLKVAGHDMRQAVTDGWPVPAFDLEPKAARELCATFWPEVVLDSVHVLPVSRDPPGTGDPLIGVLELTATAHGRVSGVRGQCRLLHRLGFRVGCVLTRRSAPTGTYRQVHYGPIALLATPLGSRSEF